MAAKLSVQMAAKLSVQMAAKLSLQMALNLQEIQRKSREFDGRGNLLGRCLRILKNLGTDA